MAVRPECGSRQALLVGKASRCQSCAARQRSPRTRSISAIRRSAVSFHPRNDSIGCLCSCCLRCLRLRIGLRAEPAVFAAFRAVCPCPWCLLTPPKTFAFCARRLLTSRRLLPPLLRVTPFAGRAIQGSGKAIPDGKGAKGSADWRCPWRRHAYTTHTIIGSHLRSPPRSGTISISQRCLPGFPPMLMTTVSPCSSPRTRSMSPLDQSRQAACHNN